MEPSSETLEEIMVTGYGVTKKAAFTGAATTISETAITKQNDSNPIKALEGSVPGLQMNIGSGQPGAPANIFIRGKNSFNSGTQPLYIIDGVPFNADPVGVRADEEQTVSPLSTLNASGDVSDVVYQTMWSDIAITAEDIFTVAKTNDDNLSANALNMLYGSYGATLSPAIETLFGSDDIRLKLIAPGNRPLKFDGIPSAQAVSNIPVFRKSEMYLIIAEVEALAGNITEAQNALFYPAKRNPAIRKPADLPSAREELIRFISEENVREFFEEGHRWYNVRRTGKKITPHVTGVTAYNMATFVYPVPADEINASFCTQQNEKWEDGLPE